MNKNSDEQELKSVISIKEAIDIAQKDIKELRKNLNEINNCKEIEVTIIRKNGTKIPVIFFNKQLDDFLKESLIMIFKSMQKGALETEKDLLKFKKEGEESEQSYTVRFL
ncbi:hypothetical protein KLN18_18635 [Clostridioides difficile]|nr:hypothetical protein [Clostridioides difficile]